MLTGVIGTAGEGREDALETEVQEYGKIELDKWLKRNKDGLVKQIFNSKDVKASGLDSKEKLTDL